MPIAGIDMIVGTMLTTIDRQRQWAMTAVAAALLNPAANLIAIPLTHSVYGNGAIGAAVVTTATELFMVCVGVRLLPRGLMPRSTFVYVGRCLLSGLLMAVVVFAVRDLALIAAVSLGALTYGAGSLALKTVSLSELRQLRAQILGRALAPGVIAPEQARG